MKEAFTFRHFFVTGHEHLNDGGENKVSEFNHHKENTRANHVFFLPAYRKIPSALSSFT